MKSTGKEADLRKAERRSPPTERRADAPRAVAGERRVVENRGVAEAMVDALEDILRWERASERTMKVAAKVSMAEPASTPELSN
jgi:hypothetical protein